MTLEDNMLVSQNFYRIIDCVIAIVMKADSSVSLCLNKSERLHDMERSIGGVECSMEFIINLN